VWAQDGKHILFDNRDALFWVRSDGAADPQLLLKPGTMQRPGSISPDGRELAYYDVDPEMGFDIWTLPLDLTDSDHPRAGKPEVFLRTSANELLPRFSPDGRWIAYRSDESGSYEVYVRPFPPGRGGKWQISAGGGLYALWAKNGRELFYETVDNRIMVVDYTVNGDSFDPAKPRLWSDKQLFYTGESNLDLAPDGKRFLVFESPEAPKNPPRIVFLLNFFDELRRKIQ
jgi:serine/threonine-protein kinase